MKHNLESLTNPSDPFLRFSSPPTLSLSSPLPPPPPTPFPPLCTQAGQQGRKVWFRQAHKKRFMFVAHFLNIFW